MKVKEIERTANIAWSPASHHPIYLAAGTAAQQLDATFSTSAALEIYALNLHEPGFDMGLKTSLATEHRFTKVVWGGHGIENDSEGLGGIIVGGTDSGQLITYNPAKLLLEETPTIFTSNKHTGAIYSMDFNPFQDNLLVSGAGESEIFIWDLNNPTTPLTPGAKTQPFEEVSCVAWNRQVQHILASTFPGRCVVWDLRKNEPIIKVADPSAKLRCKVVDWHPEVATQLCLASEDDQSPLVQLWDLRFATAPLKSLEKHTRGVLSIAWCQRDPDLLLSCGKDSRILCWNPNSNAPGGEVVCELPTNNQWSFEVLWCPRNPAVIASSSFDGHVSVYSLMGGQPQAQPTSSKIVDSFPGADLSPAPTPPLYPQAAKPSVLSLQKPPKWLRRPVGANFAFGGKLVSFLPDHSTQGQVGGPLVFISQVVTEPQLLNKSSKLETALNSGALSAFCQEKTQEAGDEQHRMIWSFLQASFDQSPRSSMLSLLGYNPSEIANLVKPASKRSSPAPVCDNDIANDVAQMRLKDDNTFDTIAANEKKADRKLHIDTDTGTSEGLVSCALLTGNIAAAVELFVQEERWADALLLAQAGGQELALETQLRYLESGLSNTARLISAVVTSNWSQVVNSVELSCWKEALAAVLTYARPEEFSSLCQRLGTRLENWEGSKNGDLNMLPQAMLCFICAGSLHRLTACWSKWHHTAKEKDSPHLLQDLVEQIVVLRQTIADDNQAAAAGEKSGESLSEILGRYAYLLASQGSLASASTYIMQADSPSLLILRDRIYQSLNLQSPHFPFNKVDVKAHVQQQQAKQQVLPQQQQQVSGRRVAPSPVTAVAQPYQHYQPQQQQQQFQPQQQQFQQPTNIYNQPQPPVSMYPQQQSQNVPSGYMYNPVPGDMGPPPSPSPFLQPQTVSYQQQQFQPTTMVPSQPAPPPPPPTSSASDVNRKGTHHMSQRYPKHVQDSSVYSDPMYRDQGANFAGGHSAQSFYSQAPSSGSYFQSPPQQQQQMAPQQQSYYSVEQNSYPASSSTPSPFIPPPSAAMASSSVMPPLSTEIKPGWNDPPPIKHAQRNSSAGLEGPGPIMAPMGAPLMPGQEPPASGGSYFQGNYPSGMAQQTGYGVPTQVVPPMTNMQTQQMLSQGYSASQPVPQPTPPPPPQPEPPREKKPIPPEHQLLPDTFEDLRNQCMSSATNPQMRRKLDDVARKLEYLYDKLRDNSLSPQMLSGLHELIRAVQQGAYQGALSIHSQLVSGTDFSETASFMPGLKVLLQTAQQLGVYLQ